MATFDNIKVGDKVIYYPNSGFGIVTLVTRVTPAGNFTIDETDRILWDKNGNIRGTKIWNRSWVQPYSKEAYEKIMELKMISKAVKLIHKCDESDLTVEQAKAIIEILEDK